jgi:LasA protease
MALLVVFPHRSVPTQGWDNLLPWRQHHVVLRMLLLSLGLLSIAIPLVLLRRAIAGKPQPAAIEQSVIAAITRLKGNPAAHGTLIKVQRVSEDQRWAFGTVALLIPTQKPPTVEAAALPDDIPEGRLWLAHQTSRGWMAALDATLLFDRWLEEAPPAVVSTEEQAILGSAGPESRSATEAATTLPSSQLSLPWAPGQSWMLTGGPHGWGGGKKEWKQRPWSALDFAGGDGRVRAAREGLVYLPCGETTWIQIRHGDGWVTDYYHLTNIPQFVDGTWIERGQ